MKSNPMVAVAVALLIGCVAFPVTLHHMTLSRIREMTFAATRFAAMTPEALRTLPVTHWEAGGAVSQPLLSKTGWEQYRMTIPQGEKSLIVDLDLRSTLLPLLLGVGGLLRIAVMMLVSGATAYVMMRCRVKSETLPPPLMGGGQGEGDLNRAQFVEPTIAFSQKIMDHLPHAALLFDRHHQLVHWNDVAQAAIAHLILTPGIHLLDLAAHLPWGAEMLEKMDELSLQQTQSTPDHILMIHKGGLLCVIPG